MPPITWKTIAIPDLNASMQAMPAVSDSFNRAAANLKGILTDRTKLDEANWDQETKNNTAAQAAKLRGTTNLAELNGDAFSPESNRAAFGAQIDQEALDAVLAKQKGVLTDTAVGDAFLARSNAFDTNKSQVEANAAADQSLRNAGVTGKPFMDAGNDIRNASKDNETDLTKAVTLNNTKSMVGQLNLHNLQDVLKQGRETHGDKFDEGAVTAGYKAMSDAAAETTLTKAVNIVGTTGNTTDGVTSIIDADLPNSLKLTIMDKLQQIGENAKPSDVDKLTYDVNAGKNKIAFNERMITPRKQLTSLQESAKIFAAGGAIVKAAEASIAAGGVNKGITDGIVDETFFGQILGKMSSVKGGENGRQIITDLHKSLVNGPERLSEDEANQVILAAGQSAGADASAWHNWFGGKGIKETPFKKEVARLADQTNKYKLIGNKIAGLAQSIQQDETDHAAAAEQSGKNHLLDSQKAVFTGGKIDPTAYHKTAAPGTLKSEQFYSNLGIPDSSKAKTAGEVKTQTKANATELKKAAGEGGVTITTDDAAGIEQKNQVPPGTVDYFLGRESSNKVGQPIKNGSVKNSGSSATGVMQMLKATAEAKGIDPTDPVASVNAAMEIAAKNTPALAKVLGRLPEIDELYLAHQQGLAGSTALITNPDSNAIEALIAIGVKPAKAKASILQNGGETNDTAAEFMAKNKKHKGTYIADVKNKLIGHPTDEGGDKLISTAGLDTISNIPGNIADYMSNPPAAPLGTTRIAQGINQMSNNTQESMARALVNSRKRNGVYKSEAEYEAALSDVLKRSQG